ncbi:MAG: 1-acyl-sn-glycerol-3-phosphate acyltransferase [Pseudomonadota bacterium]
MRDKLDPLIAERAPWLCSKSAIARVIKPALDRILRYDRTVALGKELELLTAQQIMSRMEREIAQRVTVSGRWNIPSAGAALIVANHPTGIADAIMLSKAIQPVRDDIFFYANRDILRVLPQLGDMIAPVEWREERRSHSSLRETMDFTRRAVTDGRLGIIFPSGRLAKRTGVSLAERPWMASAAMIARKFRLPVIPIHLRARNSNLFYALDVIHHTLRDVTLFHETLNKDRQPYHISVGEPISPSALPARSDEAITLLKTTVEKLGKGAATVAEHWSARAIALR